MNNLTESEFVSEFSLTPTDDCFELETSLRERPCIAERIRDRQNNIDEPDLRALCQKTECLTKENKVCKFPFRFKGRLYDTCITLESQEPWCSLHVDINHNHIEGDNSRGICSATCNVLNCPVGFEHIEGNCFQFSARTYSDMVRNNSKAEEVCASLGSRLYEPRNIESFERMESYYGKFFKPVDLKFFPKNSGTPSFLAIGAKTKLLTPNLALEYNGGSRAYMIEKKIKLQGTLQSHTNFDLTSNSDTGCITVDLNGDLNVEHCSDYNGIGSTILGYICEAKVQTTMSGSEADKVCHFPFKEDATSTWKTSCVFDDPRGKSICATEVDANGIMVVDKWGVCLDEREIAYTSSGLSKDCQFPYLYERVWYDSCKLKPEEEIWCPTSINPTRQFDVALDEKGFCTEYMRPSMSSCDQNYKLVNGICIRVSPFAETFENAAKMCSKEGAFLLTIPDEHLMPSVMEHISFLTRTKVHFKPEFSPDLSSYWIGGNARDLKWSWMSNGKNLSVYSDWADEKENSGCVEFLCTDNYGLTLNAKNRFKWTAVDKSSEYPYICQSQCGVGYKWFPRVKKCLKLYDFVNTATLLSAQFSCAADNARLVDLKQCKDFVHLAEDIWEVTKSTTEFWLGYFVGGLDNYNAKRISSSERLSKHSISSMGYLAVQDCGFTVPTDLSKSFSGFLKYVNEDLTSADMLFEEIQHLSPLPEKGYLCEKEQDWSCPDNHVLYQEECYILHLNPKSFTEAWTNCFLNNEHLFESSTILHNTFLIHYAKENSITGKLWTGYRRHITNSTGVTDEYFKMSNNRVTSIDFTGLLGNLVRSLD